MLPLMFFVLQAAAPVDTLKVTILGSGGGPNPRAEWAGPSALVEYGREVILIDAGRDALLRMTQSARRPEHLRVSTGRRGTIYGHWSDDPPRLRTDVFQEPA
jgi:hypothetical protein